MKVLSPLQAARAAVSAHAGRPATAILHDTPDLRLVVFRLSPGEAVPPHRSASTVMLTVLEGAGILAGQGDDQPDERWCVVGDHVTYAPSELHDLRATDQEFIVLAAITPRPGSR
ncbi:MAG: Cupin 2 conserved barrel domain protein [Gemmatimonadetes bacterium]|jgi:quercetin dioxygenase-like cupin family protein|nr:Cupin 2 conserved barrel domain protein [Gemmatimonadota bacterium]